MVLVFKHAILESVVIWWECSRVSLWWTTFINRWWLVIAVATLISSSSRAFLIRRNKSDEKTQLTVFQSFYIFGVEKCVFAKTYSRYRTYLPLKYDRNNDGVSRGHVFASSDTFRESRVLAIVSVKSFSFARTACYRRMAADTKIMWCVECCKCAIPYSLAGWKRRSRNVLGKL